MEFDMKGLDARIHNTYITRDDKRIEFTEQDLKAIELIKKADVKYNTTLETITIKTNDIIELMRWIDGWKK